MHTTEQQNADSLTYEHISAFFHLPLSEAAQRLSLSTSKLKAICRKYHVPRWPFRQIESLNKTIRSLEHVAKKTNTQHITESLQLLHQEKIMTVQNMGKNSNNSSSTSVLTPSNQVPVIYTIQQQTVGGSGSGQMNIVRRLRPLAMRQQTTLDAESQQPHQFLQPNIYLANNHYLVSPANHRHNEQDVLPCIRSVLPEFFTSPSQQQQL